MKFFRRGHFIQTNFVGRVNNDRSYLHWLLNTLPPYLRKGRRVAADRCETCIRVYFNVLEFLWGRPIVKRTSGACSRTRKFWFNYLLRRVFEFGFSTMSLHGATTFLMSLLCRNAFVVPVFYCRPFGKLSKGARDAKFMCEQTADAKIGRAAPAEPDFHKNGKLGMFK